MKRKIARAATVVALVGALTGAAAAGAQAYPGWEFAGAFGWSDHCLGVGHVGVQDGSWDRYFCEEIYPANPASGPGYYKLWVQ